jgi:predicted transcriptional regulator
MTNQILVVDPLERQDILRSLASEVRVRILEHLTRNGPRNVNQVSDELDLPQSTVSSNIQILVDAGWCRPGRKRAARAARRSAIRPSPSC